MDFAQNIRKLLPRLRPRQSQPPNSSQKLNCVQNIRTTPKQLNHMLHPVSVVFAAHHFVQMASFANIVVKPFHCNVILMHDLNEYAMQRN